MLHMRESLKATLHWALSLLPLDFRYGSIHMMVLITSRIQCISGVYENHPDSMSHGITLGFLQDCSGICSYCSLTCFLPHWRRSYRYPGSGQVSHSCCTCILGVGAPWKILSRENVKDYHVAVTSFLEQHCKLNQLYQSACLMCRSPRHYLNWVYGHISFSINCYLQQSALVALVTEVVTGGKSKCSYSNLFDSYFAINTAQAAVHSAAKQTRICLVY